MHACGIISLPTNDSSTHPYVRACMHTCIHKSIYTCMHTYMYTLIIYTEIHTKARTLCTSALLHALPMQYTHIERDTNLLPWVQTVSNVHPSAKIRFPAPCSLLSLTCPSNESSLYSLCCASSDLFGSIGREFNISNTTVSMDLPVVSIIVSILACMVAFSCCCLISLFFSG
jgi:hypothetical protein